MKYYLIYKIVDKFRDNRVYIGQHSTDNINDNYYGSGTLLRKEIKKWLSKGRKFEERFTKEILYTFDTFDEMNLKEIELVNEEFLKGNVYNITTGGSFKKNSKSGRKKLKLPEVTYNTTRSATDEEVKSLFDEVMNEI